jgi:hypothetical protein
MSCDLVSVVADNFQRTDMQRLRCYALHLPEVIYLTIRRMNTPHSALSFGMQLVYCSEHRNTRTVVTEQKTVVLKRKRGVRFELYIKWGLYSTNTEEN